MALPIQPTPELEGEDAKRLLEDLENVCSPEEAKRRIAWAKERRQELMRDKTSSPKTPTPGA